MNVTVNCLLIIVRLVGSKAAIGFDYEGGTRAMTSSSFLSGESPLDSDDDDDEDDKLFSSESDYEVDMDVDIMSRTDVDRLNMLALEYGVTGGYFSRCVCMRVCCVCACMHVCRCGCGCGWVGVGGCGWMGVGVGVDGYGCGWRGVGVGVDGYGCGWVGVYVCVL